MIVYTAGPYRGNADRNIEQAKDIAHALWLEGHAAVCPHANSAHMEDEIDLPNEAFLAGDLEILARCDAIVMTPDWEISHGAIEEKAFAEARGIPVYFWPDMPKQS